MIEFFFSADGVSKTKTHLSRKKKCAKTIHENHYL